MLEYFYMFLVGLAAGIFIGFYLGVWSESSKWRANADNVMRIYSRKRLYKVEYADKRPSIAHACPTCTCFPPIDTR